jgi:hypothetical protein
MWPELARVLRKNGSAAFWVRVPTSESLLTQSLLSLALHLHRFTQSFASPVIRHSHTESTLTPKASTHYTASVHTGSNPAVQSWRTTWSRFQKAMKSYPARSRISRGCSSQVRLETMLARHYIYASQATTTHLSLPRAP